MAAISAADNPWFALLLAAVLLADFFVSFFGLMESPFGDLGCFEALRLNKFSYIIKILENKDNVKGIIMTKLTKTELKKRALTAVRDYGVNLTLLRNAMGDWLGLNVTDMECLRLLFLKGTATPSELARHTGLTSGAATAMLDRLEKAGLIARRPNPQDRRGTLVSPVKSAAEKVASGFESARRAQDELISSYSEKELEIISDAFERFTKIWEQERNKVQKVS